MGQDYSLVITDLLLKLLKQDITIPNAIEEINDLVVQEVEKRCEEQAVNIQSAVMEEDRTEPMTPVNTAVNKNEPLGLREVSRILDFMNYFRKRLSRKDPLYPFVKIYNDMIKDLDNQHNIKDKQIASALKSTYSYARSDLQRNKGNGAVQAYQKLLEENSNVDFDFAAVSRSSYYDAIREGKEYFRHRCNTLLDSTTIAEAKKFISKVDQIKGSAKNRVIAYRDSITQFLKNREEEIKIKEIKESEVENED